MQSVLLCTPITVEDIASALRDTVLAAEQGADIVEFRVDGFFDADPVAMPTSISQLVQLVAQSQLPCIVTCRHISEGGAYDGPDDARIAMYEALCTTDGPTPAYIDIELRAFLRSADTRQKLSLCVHRPGQSRDVKTKLILSVHDFQQLPSDLSRSIAAMIDEPSCAVVKVAARARNVLDAVELLDACRRCSKPAILIAMGEFGMMSRMLAGKWGGFLSFAPLATRDATAPGQLSLKRLIDEFGVRRVRSHTHVYGIVGWPVATSLSPLVHNAAFAQSDEQTSRCYVHLPIASHDTTDGDDSNASEAAFAATLLELVEHDRLHLCGASVTMPHKRALATLASKHQWELDDASRLIGAANTLIIQREFATDGSSIPRGVRVANTDAIALHQLLIANIPHSSQGHSALPLQGKVVGIVGAGGVGAAAAWAAASAGAHVAIYNRTPSKAAELARKLVSGLSSSRSNAIAASNIASSASPSIVAMPWDSLPAACCDAFVQCTSIGMNTNDAAAFPTGAMNACKGNGATPLLIETVYRPRDTATLLDARAAGWRTIDGTALFVKQAELQSAMWLGKPPKAGVFQNLVDRATSD